MENNTTQYKEPKGNEYINYDLSLKLQSKGFHQPVKNYYLVGDKRRRTHVDINSEWYQERKDTIILSPTHQQVKDWLRKEKKMFISETISPYTVVEDEDDVEYVFKAHWLINHDWTLCTAIHKDYYDAFNKIIDKALDHLQS